MDFLYKQIEKFKVIRLVILFFSAITNGQLLPSTSLSLQEIHLVRCLTYISHRYFAPGRSLVISSPSTYRDVQQELIAEIQRTAIWPVVVAVNGNISKATKTHFIDRDGSYIILTPGGNLKSFMAEFIGLLYDQNHSFTRFWNSESRFVVAGAKEFTKSQQTDIFDYFSNFRIYNCIIISREHYLIDYEYSSPKKVNDVDKGTKFGVYTWFPYQSSDRCTEVNDITILDSWVISAQGQFTKNTDLFPRKISKNFNGCPMKAVVRDRHSDITTNFVQYKNNDGSFVMNIKGMESLLLKIVLQQMNMTFVHVRTPEGFETREIFANNLIEDMIKKKTYIALGGVVNSFLSKDFFDSPNSYYIMRARWYVPCSIKLPRWSSIFRILSVELWLVLIISIVLVAISITLVVRYTCKSEWHGYKTLTSSLTNVCAVLLGVPVSTLPRAPSLRSLFFAWVCFSLAFSTVIQAFLTTFLVDSGYKTPIQNMDELFASGIKLAYPPEYLFIFANHDDSEASKVQSNQANCPSFEVCINWTLYQKNVSIVLTDHSVEEGYATGYLVGENSEPLLRRLDDGVVHSTGLTMIMFYEDPLMKRVTEIIDRVVEAGIYNYWISMYMNVRKLYSRKIPIDQMLDEYYSFNLYNMQPAFYHLLIGWFLSVICFMIEVLYNRILTKRK